MFGLFKKKYPMFKSEMIQPENNLISTTEAKKFYKIYMKETGFIVDAQERSMNATYLGNAIKEQEKYFKVVIEEKKSEIKYSEDQIKPLNSKLDQCEEDEKFDIEVEIDSWNEEIEDYNKEIQIAKTKLDEFKKDKRAYLIDYVNDEVHQTGMDAWL